MNRIHALPQWLRSISTANRSYTPASHSYSFPVLDYKSHPTPYTVSLCQTQEAVEKDLEYYLAEAQKETIRISSVKKGSSGSKMGGTLLKRCVSLDIEWSPNQSPVALLQLANDERISLFHLSRLGSFPTALTSLLENPTIIKCGVNIAGDATRLYKEQGVKLESYLELQDLAKKLENPIESKRASLYRLCLHYLERHMDKDVPFTFHYHWTRHTLSPAHISYAANDAYALYWVLQALLVQIGWNESFQLPLRSYQRDVLANRKSK